MKKPSYPVRNCPFCKEKAEFCHTENNDTGMVYQCMNCPVLVFLHYSHDSREKEAKLDKVVYVIDKQGHLYTWTDNYSKRSSYITDLNVMLLDLKDKNPILVTFPKLMNVTPANVREKFGFYMVFL